MNEEDFLIATLKFDLKRMNNQFNYVSVPYDYSLFIYLRSHTFSVHPTDYKGEPTMPTRIGVYMEGPDKFQELLHALHLYRNFIS